MVNRTEEYQDASVGDLAIGILDDAQDLIHDHLLLIKSEMKEELHKTRNATFELGSGVAVGMVGALFLAFMLVHLLDALFPQLPLWACFGMIGVLLLAGGYYLYDKAKQRLNEVAPPYPEESIETAEETVEEIKRRM